MRKRKQTSTLKSLLTAAAFTGVVLGGLKVTDYVAEGPETRTDCEVYQGYMENNADGFNFAIFDPRTKEFRKDTANFTLADYKGLSDSLRIGERYCFTHTIPKSSYRVSELVSAEPDTSYRPNPSTISPRKSVDVEPN